MNDCKLADYVILTGGTNLIVLKTEVCPSGQNDEIHYRCLPRYERGVRGDCIILLGTQMLTIFNS